MEKRILDQEKFKVVQELAEIHGNISAGKVELTKLKEATDAYMHLREQEAEERVIKVLRESRDALEEVSTNHRELIVYNNDLKAYANEIHELTTDIISLFQNFNVRMKEAEKDIEINQKLVSGILTKIKIERVQVKEDRKMLAIERHKTEEGKRLLADKRASLERAWEELKKLQAKYQ